MLKTLRLARTVVVLSTLSIVSAAATGRAGPADPVQSQDQTTMQRLEPAVFTELPTSIRVQLANERCTVPQASAPSRSDRNNVIRGHFVRSDQWDWAVLCSNGKESAIRIFWGAPTACATSVRPANEVDYFNDLDHSYNRIIRSVSEQDLRGWSGPPEPGVMKHDGIQDEWFEKTATAIYCDGRVWITVALAGS